jgi:hypothetical protein
MGLIRPEFGTTVRGKPLGGEGSWVRDHEELVFHFLLNFNFISIYIRIEFQFHFNLNLFQATNNIFIFYFCSLKQIISLLFKLSFF